MKKIVISRRGSCSGERYLPSDEQILPSEQSDKGLWAILVAPKSDWHAEISELDRIEAAAEWRKRFPNREDSGNRDYYNGRWVNEAHHLAWGGK